MQCCIRQTPFSFGDHFSVTDENEKELYHAEGEIFTMGKKLHVYETRTEQEVLYIEQELFHLRPHYNLFVHGTMIGTVIQEFSFFGTEYTFEGPGWEIVGEFMAHDWKMYHNGAEIAQVTKEWFTFGDCYTVTADRVEDMLPALAVMLSIDCMAAQQRR